MLCSENGAENAGKPSGWNAEGKALTGNLLEEFEKNWYKFFLYVW